MKKKAMAILLVGVIIMMCITGCGTGAEKVSAPENTSEAPEGSETVENKTASSSGDTLTIWVHPNEGNLKVFNEYCKPLIEEKTGMDVEFVVKSMDNGQWSSYLNSCVASLAAGETPDIICSAIEGHQFMLSKNLLAPMDDLIANDPEGQAFVDSMVPIAVDTFRSDGKLWQLPYSLEMMCIWYNLDMFEKAGIEPIDPAAGWTWDEFLEIAKKLTIETDDGKVYGAGLKFGGIFVDTPWFLTNGATIVNDDFTKATVDTAQFKESMEFLNALVNVEKVAPMVSSDESDMIQLFLANRVAMCSSGGWSVATVKNGMDGNYGVAPWPKPADSKNTANTVYGMCSMGIYRDSAHKDAAWEAIKIMGSAGASEQLWTVGGQSPAVSSVLNSELMQKQYPVGYETWNVMSENMNVIPYPTTFPEIEIVYSRNLISYLNGQSDVDAAVSAMQSEISEIFAEDE